MSRERPLVLIADDDPDILVLVALALERAGCDTVPARDGAEALELAQAHSPDLAVLDVMMPRLDGCEVTQRLRADEATRALPVILLTALAEEAHATRGLSVGADDYMKKPFSPRELGTRVTALLARPTTSLDSL